MSLPRFPFSILHALGRRMWALVEAKIQPSIVRWPWYLHLPAIGAIERRQHDFFVPVLGMIARVLESDGSLTRLHLQQLDTILRDDFGLSAPRALLTLELFHKLRKTSYPFESFAYRFFKLYYRQPALLRQILLLLIQLSYQDGRSRPTRRILLEQARSIFHLGSDEFKKLLQRSPQVGAHSGEEARSYQNDWQRYSSQAAFTATALELERSYRLLGCRVNDTAATVRKRYRELALKFHPDRLSTNGLTHEYRNFAETHFREIQTAYELVREECERRERIAVDPAAKVFNS